MHMRSTVDGYRYQALRRKLVEILREKGITDENVLEAIGKIPRHFFLDKAFEDVAYEDRAFPIEQKQTISQPYTVAYQTQLLQMKPYQHVLEIGTGSGYQCSVLAEMGARVFSVERQKPLYDILKHFEFLKKYRNIKYFYGDGYEGLPTYAPFDKIIVTAAAPFVPQKLIQQLVTGGCLVIPVGENNIQRMLRITKSEDGTTTTEEFDNFSFVPMLTGRNIR